MWGERLLELKLLVRVECWSVIQNGGNLVSYDGKMCSMYVCTQVLHVRTTHTHTTFL